jgi:arylsulfatase
MSEPRTDALDVVPQSRQLAVVALVAALTAGFLDAVVSVLSAPEDFASWPAVLPPLALTAGIVLVLFGALAALVAALPARLRPSGVAAPALALTALVASTARFASPDNTLLGFHDCRPEMLVCPPYAARLFLPLLVGSALLLAVAWFAETRGRTDPDVRDAIARALLALPFLAAEMAAFAWASVYLAPRGLPAVACGLLAAGIVGATAFALRRVKRTAPLIAGVVLLGMAVAGGGVAGAVLSDRSDRPVPTAATRAPRGVAPGGGPRHVVLITIDALRADALSCYREGAGPTPNIDRLAATGALFTDAMAPSDWTLPALASAMTGFSPTVHRTVLGEALPRELPTLAELLSDAGYFTTAVVANALLKPRSGFSRGFAVYTVATTKSAPASLDVNGMLGAQIARRFSPAVAQATSADLTRQAVGVLEQRRDEPVFIWLHYMDTHGPYEPPAAYAPKGLVPAPVPEGKPGLVANLHTPGQRAWAQALYAAEARAVDEQVGVLLREMERLKVADDALIVLTADHGEAFWEHGMATHANGLYAELVQVPLIVKRPGSRVGVRVAGPVSTQAVFPTVLGLCRVPYSHEVQADSLESLLKGDSRGVAPRPVVIASIGANEDRLAVLFEAFKYIRSIGAGREELYDLSRDPGEQMSLVLVAPETLARGRALANAHLAQAAALRQRLGLRDATPMPLDEDTRRRMRALGYLR